MPQPSLSEESKRYRLPSDELITEDVTLKMEVIQSLLEPCDRTLYRQRKEAAAQKLGVSLRSIERLLKKHREQGFVGITKTRSDKGQPRISEDWHQFILDTYKKEYPSHQTVYRIIDQ